MIGRPVPTRPATGKTSADTDTVVPTTAPLGRPEGRYHSDQITAHWIVVFIVLFQLATGGTMEAAMDRGYASDMIPQAGVVYVHGIFGTTILLTMLWRVTLRLKYGAPPPPDTEPGFLQVISRGVHFAFYGILIAMPLAGVLALFTLNETIGTLHGLASKLLIALALAHVAGAIWHAFKRDGVVTRILSGQPPQVTVPPAEQR